MFPRNICHIWSYKTIYGIFIVVRGWGEGEFQMRREAPDPRFYSEIHDLNLEFLRLVKDGRRGTRRVFGLDSAVADQIARLTAAQLEAAVATPCLLAVIARIRQPGPLGTMISEPPLEAEAQWQEASRVFLASLMTYVWQTARRDPLLASLCAGRANDCGAPVREAGFRELRMLCDSRNYALRARFHEHPRFWQDLVSAARGGDPHRVHLARMSGIQLALLTGAVSAGNDFSSQPAKLPSRQAGPLR